MRTTSVALFTVGWALACSGGEPATTPEAPPAAAPEAAPPAAPAAPVDVSAAKIDGKNLVVGALTAPLDAEYLMLENGGESVRAWPGVSGVIAMGVGIDDVAQAQIFVVKDGALVEVGRAALGTDLKIDGAKVVEDFHNCGQDTHVEHGLVDGKFAETSRTVTGTYDESQCAACPFVDVKRGDDWVPRGEILRELRSPALAGVQSLELPVEHDGVLELRLAERKPETTFVDALWVEVDGARIEAVGCAWCGDGGAPEVLVNGDTRELRFEVPVDRPITVWARGYYVPDAGVPVARAR